MERSRITDKTIKYNRYLTQAELSCFSLSLKDKLTLFLSGHIYIGTYKPKGFTAPAKFYLAYANLQEFIPYQYNQQRLKNPEKSIVTQRALERALQKELQKELAITSPNANVSVSGGTAPLPPQLNNSLTFMDMPRTGKIEYISQSKNEYHPSITAITFPEASAQSMFERAYLPEAKGIEVRPLIQPKVKAYA